MLRQTSFRPIRPTQLCLFRAHSRPRSGLPSSSSFSFSESHHSSTLSWCARHSASSQSLTLVHRFVCGGVHNNLQLQLQHQIRFSTSRVALFSSAEVPSRLVDGAEAHGAKAKADSDASTKTNINTMADDEAYSRFLEGASNSDSASKPKTSSSTSVEATRHNTSAPPPAALRALESKTYTSETDAHFEPVSLSFEDKDLSAKEVGRLVGAEAEELSVKEWDVRGEYHDVVEGVGMAAGSGRKGVKVFSVGRSGARVEYWVLGVDQKGGRVVGVVVVAVES